MKLTEEQIKSNVAAYEHAMRTGNVKDIDVAEAASLKWEAKSIGQFSFDVLYRIRPTPKLRPWKPEEVPLGAWIRYKTTPEWRSIITYVSEKGIGVASFDDALHELVHSTDGGATWKPCGVMEEGE